MLSHLSDFMKCRRIIKFWSMFSSFTNSDWSYCDSDWSYCETDFGSTLTCDFEHRPFQTQNECKSLLNEEWYIYIYIFCEMQVKDQFSEPGLYISALEHVLKLIIKQLCSLASMNTINQCCHI